MKPTKDEMMDWLAECDDQGFCPCGNDWCSEPMLTGMWWEAAYMPDLMREEDWDEVERAYMAHH